LLLNVDEWPLLARGILFWTANQSKGSSEKGLIYMLGNPVVWYGTIISLAFYAAFQIRAIVMAQRGSLTYMSRYFKMSLGAAWFLTVGWMLHYLPFFIMSRQVMSRFT
jgi:dolichyl-phosphate-mannose-protein mannosyltransferase